MALLKKLPVWIRRPAALVLLGTLGFCGKASAQKVDSIKVQAVSVIAPTVVVADTTVAKTDSLVTDTVKQKKWLGRMIDKYEDKFSSKGKKRLLTLSFNDVRANLKMGKTDANPTVGFNIFNMSYLFGVNFGRTIDGVRYEVGGFTTGHTWKSDKDDNYRQVYARGIFNLKTSPKDKNPMRHLVVEAGLVSQRNFIPTELNHDRLAYAYGTYEQAIPKIRLLGPLDRDKTIMLSAYVQHNYGTNLPYQQTSFGLRANILKPFNTTAFKIITINGRLGPTFTLDSRAGFQFGFEVIRSFRKFKQSSSSTKTASNANVPVLSTTTAAPGTP